MSKSTSKAQSSANPPKDPLIGGQLASFRISGLIGRSGRIRIYHGWDVMLQRPAAVRVIDTRGFHTAAKAKRFLHEIRPFSTWRHEHIIQVYYANTEEALYYYAMEYIDGIHLKQALATYNAENKLMPHHDVLQIGQSVARALDFAHQQGVLHLDVQPSNILYSVDKRVILTDFLLSAVSDARAASTDLQPISPYVAPEVRQDQAAATVQSDVYSLTAVLFEMLAGAPFTTTTQAAGGTMPFPSKLNDTLSLQVSRVLLKGLDTRPQNRFLSPLELVTALKKELQEGDPVTGGWKLPPLPAAVQNEVAPINPFSRDSVAERVAAQRESQAAAMPRQTAATVDSSGRRWWLWAGGILLLFLIAFWAFGRLGGADSDPTPAPASVETAAAIGLAPTETPTAATATATTVPPTAVIPTATPAPTDTAQPTPTLAPTDVAITVTITLTPTETPLPTATATAVVQNTGPLLRFLYDDYSFYVWNPGDVPIDIGFISFEAITDDGFATEYLFLGRNWANFYATLDPGNCNRIEPGGAPGYLRPSVCSRYNASITPPSMSSNVLFWIPRDGITQFVVRWSGREIGQCAIVLGLCEVNLPQQ